MNTTHLTDFISPEVLAREGFVHTSDSAQMLEKIDKAYLAQCGYVNLSALRDVKLSVRKAAEVAGAALPSPKKKPRKVGISAITMKEYVKMGCVQVDADGYVSLLDAIAFDYAAAKRKYLDSKSR